MKSLRKFVYATAMTLSAFSILPSLASAQEARGHFTLTHDVRWQNAAVPAGDYRFTLVPNGSASMLTLTKMSGGRTGFMLLVNDTGAVPTSSGIDRLVLVSRGTGSFVSEMALPEYGMTLHFAVPAEKPATEVAAIPATSVVASSR